MSTGWGIGARWSGWWTSTVFRRISGRGFKNDPNREDDPEYIVRLVGQVVTVSVETVKLVGALAGLGIENAAS
jgi:hypothetical protein